MSSQIILAVDTSDFDTARGWIECTRENIDVYKLGLEFFLTFGSQGISKISQEFEVDIFLDLKLHDIPNTVKKSTEVVASLNPKFLTVHASGGSAMIAAAVSAVSNTSITAVTILTSLSASELAQIGYRNGPLESAVALAKLAVAAGATSIVCSPHEIAGIRGAVGGDIKIITPGVRPAIDPDSALTAQKDDQMRTMTPKEAIQLGASYVVVGRPISSAWERGALAMGAAAAKIADDIRN